jgi:hypothetical protein
MAALRVQEVNCRRTLKEYEYLIQEAKERDDAQSVVELTQRGHELNLVLDGIFKAKEQRLISRRQ